MTPEILTAGVLLAALAPGVVQAHLAGRRHRAADTQRRTRRRCHICPRPLVTADEIARGVCNTCHDSAFPEPDGLLTL